MSNFQAAGQSDPQRIVILRALQVGDLLCAIPAFRALKSALPKAKITLVGLPWAQDFVDRFSYLDDFIRFPGVPGFSEQTPDLRRFPVFLHNVQNHNFDLAIQMQGPGGIANTLVGLWNAKHMAGFFLRGQYCPDPGRFLNYPENETEVWRHLRLMEFLGFPLQGDELEFPLLDADWKAFRKLQHDFGIEDEFICVHPGARFPEHRWPADHFAGVADRLAALGHQVVLTGTCEEAGLTAAVAQQMKYKAIDAAGQTRLGTMAALVSQARLVVSNDTGVSHIASAVKTPSVILFSTSDAARWAPQNKQLHRPVHRALSLSAAEVSAHVENHLQEIYTYAR